MRQYPGCGSNRALGQFGRVDILLNNVGITHRAKGEDFATAEWDAVLAINLHAVFLLCHTDYVHGQLLAVDGGWLAR